MKKLWLLLIGVICLLDVAFSKEAVKDVENKMKKIAMSKKEFEKVEKLHYGWYVQAVHALLGAMGKDLYMKMDRNNRKAFVACMDGIEKEYDLQMGAECLVKAFDNKLIEAFPEVLYSPQYDFIGSKMPVTKKASKKAARRRRLKKLIKGKAKKKVTKKIIDEAYRERRAKRLLKQRMYMSNNIRRLSYDKDRSMVRRRMRRNILSLYANEETQDIARERDHEDSPYKVKIMNKVPSLGVQKKSPVKMLTKAIKGMFRDLNNQTIVESMALDSSYKRLRQLQDTVVGNNRDSQFKHRMLDMVIGKNHPFRRPKSFTDRFKDVMSEPVDKNVYGLVDTVSKHSKDVNYNMLSPRFFPIMPDKYDGSKKLLSPNLFPFYKDDSGNSILPIPDVLEKSGMDTQDRNSILELVMEMSGVNNAVDDAMKTIKGLKLMNMDKDVLGITNFIDDMFQNLSNSLNKDQKLHMKNKKFAFLEKEQLEQVYGENSMLNSTIKEQLPFDIHKYGDMKIEEKEEILKNTIRDLATGFAQKQMKHRVKRFYEITHFQHTTLAPYIFAPTVNSLTVLGPITLSPSVFSPNIISPLLISPPVISPQVGNPLIFSPYVLGPNVLSAAVFNVYVFSPYVLAPNVINPYVMSPLILSPFVLCPDVVSPTILSGVVLSPSVLSPSVFTESALAANVLSPTFLS